jgi:AraC-like DNA-binding protein/quercetin dioxygenase-like cupin family protein
VLYLKGEETAMTRKKKNLSATQPNILRQLPRVQSMGISVWDPVWSKQMHVNHMAELVHIIKGDVVLHLKGKKFKGSTGDTLIIPSGQSHRDEFPADTTFEALLVHFDWPGLAQVVKFTTNRALTCLPTAKKQVAREMLLEMYAAFRNQGPLTREVTDVNLHRLLLFLAGSVQEAGAQPGLAETALQQEHRQQKIELVKKYIQEHLSRPITLTDLADHLGMSTYHLSHLFSQASGFTLSAYLTRTRMQQAAALLADPKNRVQEVGGAVGFDDPNYFAKAFRRYFSLSPSAYRVQALRKKGQI